MMHQFKIHLKFATQRLCAANRLNITQTVCQVIMCGCISATSLAPLTVASSEVLFRDDFNYTNGLIVNEFAYWNPNDPAAHRSPIWEMDSGSLFAIGGAAWTGIPDTNAPNANSSNGNNSCVFRLTTIRSNFTNVAVSFALLNQGLTNEPTIGSNAWDGAHIFLRYQSEYYLYYASINRRENTVVIKKKVPPGPDNGGTYYVLSDYLSYRVPTNTWQLVTATVQNNQDGSVSIKLYSGNTLLVSATDDGVLGGIPIAGAGKVGIRGDNANLKFDNFTVTALTLTGPIGMVSPVTNLTVGAVDQSSLTLEWPMSSDAAPHYYFAELFSVSTAAAFSPVRLEGLRFVTGQRLQAQVSGLQSNTLYNVFVFHSKDLRNWSLPSNVAIARTGS